MRLRLIILAVLIIFCGCEQGKNKSVTGALFNRTPGVLKSYTVVKDSMTVENVFSSMNGRTTYLLCGNYQGATAFAVVKFPKPSQSILDSLSYAVMSLEVYKPWKTDNLELELYKTNNSWSDSTKIQSADFLNSLGSPITSFSDTSSSLSVVQFTFNKEDFSGWVSSGSFLIKSAENINVMVSLYSVNTTNLPSIKLITHNGAATDTTTIKSIEGNYYYSPDYKGTGTVISDGGDHGFVLKLGIPKLDVNPININSAILKLNFPESYISSDNMTVMVYRLESKFSEIDSVTIDSSSSVQLNLTPSIREYNVDILNFVHSWMNLGKTNYGILLRSYYRNASPNFVIVEPSDSLVIKYTTMPEVN